eukprot:TRINITY_DN28390_c0_g1_i1.p1 TRINITY_DN28390_c0_g1~~TRINITY_DN28390_c0_g1_i1.p1  ORF type:complete len:110 (-),score=36.10 TRINITY_DN28390_c0_g1_i1:331-660(-)
MGKSIRSKVKKKFRTIKRTALEPEMVAKNVRLSNKDKDAMSKLSLNPKREKKEGREASMDMDVARRERSEHQFGSSIGKRIRKKSRRPPNAKSVNLKKKSSTYFKKKKK